MQRSRILLWRRGEGLTNRIQLTINIMETDLADYEC